MDFGYILHWHTVVVGGVNGLNFIYGARTSLFLSSQRMPGVTDVFANV